MNEILSTAKVGLVLFQPVPNHVQSQPNKLFEYMASGLPVVASDFPHWRELTDNGSCALLVDPFDVHAIAGAMDWLLTHDEEAERMGNAGLNLVRERYNWDRESRKLLDLYDRLLGGR